MFSRYSSTAPIDRVVISGKPRKAFLSMFSATDIINFLSCRHLRHHLSKTQRLEGEKAIFPRSESGAPARARHSGTSKTICTARRWQKSERGANPAAFPGWTPWRRRQRPSVLGRMWSIRDAGRRDGEGGRISWSKSRKPSPLGPGPTKWQNETRAVLGANAVLPTLLLFRGSGQTQGCRTRTNARGVGRLQSGVVRGRSYIAYFRKVRNDFLRAGPAPTVLPRTSRTL